MKTLQEKYNALLEGNFSKAQFLRDARLAHSNIITQFNGFDDAVQILKNKGMVVEAKKAEVTAYKKPEVDPADTIAPDLLDSGIRAELEAKGVQGTPTKEEYAKAKERAVAKLIKSPLAYTNADTMKPSGEKTEKAKLHEADSKNSYVATQDMANFNTSDSIDKVSDEPVDLALAFKKMVKQNAEKYAAMSKEGIETDIEIFKKMARPDLKKYATMTGGDLVAAFDKFKEDYEADQRAQEEMDAVAGQPDIPHSLEEDIQLTPEQMKQLHRDGKITLPNGSVIHYTGTANKDGVTQASIDMAMQQAGMKETQLKEAVKALIKKVLTEEVYLEGITKINFDFRGDKLRGAYVDRSEKTEYVKYEEAVKMLATLGLKLDDENTYLQLSRDIDAKAKGIKDPKTLDSIINGIIVTMSDKTFE